MWKRLTLFFLPLGLTSFIINITHFFFNVGLARLPRPELALAAFAMAKSVVNILQAPMFTYHQLVVALVKDRKTYRQVLAWQLAVMLGDMALLALVLLTPALSHILQRWVGLSEPMLSSTVMAARVLLLLPLATGMRNTYQGIAILARQTQLILLSASIRLVFVLAVVFFGIGHLTALPGAAVGSLLFLGAIFIEAVALYLGLRPALAAPALHLGWGGEIPDYVLTPGVILRFAAPLVVAASIKYVSEPIVNVGFAQGTQPEIGLAAHAVAWSVTWTILSVTSMLHQCSLVFAGSREEGALVKFYLTVALILTGMMAVVAFTPLGDWVLLRTVGVSQEVAEAARRVLQWMVFLTPLSVVREYYWGALMSQGSSRVIGWGKGVNLVFLTLMVLAWVKLQPHHIVVLGALAILAGDLAEAIFLHVAARKSSPAALPAHRGIASG